MRITVVGGNNVTGSGAIVLDGTGTAGLVAVAAASEVDRGGNDVDGEHPVSTKTHATTTTVNDARAALLLVSTQQSSSPSPRTFSGASNIIG